MLSNRPKYLKAILFTNNLAEVGGSVVQSQCFTIQDYHYHCYRDRDSQGNPFGGFSPTGRLTEYEDGMITYGYIIGVDEGCDNDDITGDEQLLIHVRMQLCNMYFLGSNAVHYLEITKD